MGGGVSKLSLSVEKAAAQVKAEPERSRGTAPYQLFPNLTADEMDALAADIKARGVQVPVEVDEDGHILDGHHRVMIADSLGVDYPKVVRAGWTEPEKLAQVVALNAHRRHLTTVERREVIAKLRAQGASTRSIAKAVGVGKSTVAREVSPVPFGTPDRIAGADGKSYPAPAPREQWSPGAGLMSSDSVEWYTPRHILEAVVGAMGGIDLDPCAEPAKSVPATEHYTEADDGLSREWAGRVYMNPPYGRVIGAWVDKLADEYEAGRVTEAVALVPARTDTAWFAHLPWTMTAFITGRLSFSDHEAAAPFPSAACYLGPNDKAFAEAFLGLGIVTVRLEVGG
jgi:phage N-6-adenine-methyltransferase